MNSLLDSPPQSTSESRNNDYSRPSTPQQRGRPSSRYPTSLGPAHVPLHRRGTSNTYERLEDLLREAGYKETRVFTPETERAEIEAEERKERELVQGQNGTVKAGVGVVVGFLAGLMSRNSSQGGEAERGESSRTKSPVQQEYSPPPSPLAQKQRLQPALSGSSSMSPHTHSLSPTLMSSVESLPRSPLGSSSNLNPNYSIASSNSSATPRPHQQALQTRSSRLRPQPSLPTGQAQQSYIPTSRARAYLRHMASAPSIQPASKPRPELLQRHASSRTVVGRVYTNRAMVPNDSDSDSDVRTRHSGNGEGEEGNTCDRPPLPRTWLESVARAVLFGGGGAHIGGPPPLTPALLSFPQSPKIRVEATRTSPSSSNPALSDLTKRPRNLLQKRRAPPYLCAQVATQRTPSETRVSRTKVFCRSAPTSRSGSKIRGDDLPGNNRTKKGMEKHGVSRRKERLGSRRLIKGRGRDRLEVPSLTRTKAQNDSWTKVDGDMCTSSSEDEDEDEDEGELDLARLLVPSKRQNSIRSLRKHLHAPTQAVGNAGSGTRSATSSLRAPGGSRRESWDEEEDGEDSGDDWRRKIWRRDGGSLRVRVNRGTWEEGDVDGEIFENFFGTGASGTGTGTKRRRGIPGAWAQ